MSMVTKLGRMMTYLEVMWPYNYDQVNHAIA